MSLIGESDSSMVPPADTPAGPDPGAGAEDLLTGPTYALAADAARANGVFVHASLYERAPAGDPGGLAARDLVGCVVTGGEG